MLYKTEIEISELINKITGKLFSVINVGEIAIPPKFFVENGYEVIFEYSNIPDTTTFEIVNEQIVIKISDNIYLYYELVNSKSVMKIFYDIQQLNEVKMFISKLKKTIKNVE